jgi:uncharacterized membrane protein
VADEAGQLPRRAERRAPMALAVITAGVLYLMIPSQFIISSSSHVIYPTLLVVLLVVLIIGDPGRIDRENRWLRIMTGVLVSVITIGTALDVVRLVQGILDGASFDTAQELLRIGAVVWITNVIAFALWYWHLDAGGPAARVRSETLVAPAFRFPEQDLPDEVAAGWYPQFVDYLFLSFNTATSFSPTDVSPIRHWSKLFLMVESVISITVLVLVVARAINVL